MIAEDYPKGLLNQIPELEWCCGSLVDKPKLVSQVRDLINYNKALERAVMEINPKHPALRNINNELGEQRDKNSPTF